MPRPKFCVGEKVATVFNEDQNFECIVIIKMEYLEKKCLEGPMIYTGYFYYIDDGYGVGCRECFLKKLPPEERTSWEDCAWKPSEINESVTLKEPIE